jgi:hypothetical protein
MSVEARKLHGRNFIPNRMNRRQTLVSPADHLCLSDIHSHMERSGQRVLACKWPQPAPLSRPLEPDSGTGTAEERGKGNAGTPGAS